MLQISSKTPERVQEAQRILSVLKAERVPNSVDFVFQFRDFDETKFAGLDDLAGVMVSHPVHQNDVVFFFESFVNFFEG